ncbi:MAG: bifunctional precorrin-2 dehydrogenase/sirohydrochlorin ferrochelatase [Thermodesulfobacteriota bacterium]|nr:bifunctional precorrin-2 dehydrogenase/sirohydrochlorin ferrochelatase [Thermodesulfobacteriota bacterium]
MKQKISSRSYYPLSVDLRNKKVVVVGGGGVAERKVQGLLSAGAHVKLVSPEVTEALREIASDGLIDHVARAFLPEDLDRAWLVIAATDDTEVQELVYKEASSQRIFCNVVDLPEFCSFIVPSVVRRGDLCLSISTGGKSPALTRRLRKEFEQSFGSFYGDYVSLLGELRQLIITSHEDPVIRKDLCQSLAAPDVMAWVRGGEWGRVERWAVSLYGKEAANIVLNFAKASIEC